MVFQVGCAKAALAQGWYKHQFAPGDALIARLGPFGTKAEAEAATCFI